MQIILSLKFLLLVLAAILAMRFGSFGDGDGWQAILTGLTLVAAMKARLVGMGAAVGGFALGCAVAAALFLLVGMARFLLPPVLALAGILMHAGKMEAKPA